MNQIAPRAARGAVALPPMPRTSPLLTAAVDHAARGDYAPPLFIPPAHQARIAAEAGAAAEVVRQRLTPATLDRWSQFLRPLVAAVHFPPSRADFDAFVFACAGALTTIPAHLLTSRRQAEAIRRFQRWPAVADLASWLEPEAREERATLRALEKIAATPEPTAEQRDAGAEAIAAVRERAAAFRAEMREQERRATPASERPRALHLTPDQERAALRQAAAASPGREGDAARHRLAQLEQGA